MSNLRGAPLFLRPSVVRGLIEASNLIRKGVVQVPIAPIALVDRPRASEDPRLAKANDDIESGRVAPPVASELVPVQAEEAEPEDWPDAPLPEHADPDLDRAEPTPEPVSVAVDCQAEQSNPPLHDFAAQREIARRADNSYRWRRQRDATELEHPVDEVVDRLTMIREAAQRVAHRQTGTVQPRPAIGLRSEPNPIKIPVLSTQVRRERLEAATAFLKRQGVLVSVCDREAAIRKYRVGEKAESKFAEEVIAIAVERGLELPANG